MTEENNPGTTARLSDARASERICPDCGEMVVPTGEQACPCCLHQFQQELRLGEHRWRAKNRDAETLQAWAAGELKLGVALRAGHAVGETEVRRQDTEPTGGEGRDRDRLAEEDSIEAVERPRAVMIVDASLPVMLNGRTSRSVILHDDLWIGRGDPRGYSGLTLDVSRAGEEDPRIARTHAFVEFDGESWNVRDVADNDATRLERSDRTDGADAVVLNASSVALQSGDVIHIGDLVRLRFVLR